MVILSNLNSLRIMGSNRGWWNLSESTDSERAVKYNWDVSKVIGGIKVLTNKKKPNSALPRYSNTPNTVYFHQTAKGKINQLRIFRGRNSYLDIDWGHGHGKIPNGVPHMQRWKYNPKTKEVVRVGTERPLSKYMWKKYGSAIIKADPDFKYGK